MPRVKVMLVCQLLALIEHDYKVNDRRSFHSFVVHHWRHVVRLLGHMPCKYLNGTAIEHYKATRLEEGAARGSVNNQLSLLRRGLRLAVRTGKIPGAPHVQLLSGQTVREGFLTAAQFRKILATLQVLDGDAADAAEFLYASGWRLEEVLGLTWAEVTDEAIHLRRRRSKNARARTVPLVAKLREIVERRAAQRDGPNVFHRHGKPIRSFRGAWARACKVRGLDGALIHDMRRSFARNCLLAGVTREQAMAIGGWRSTRVWNRYAIVDESLLAEALAKVGAL